MYILKFTFNTLVNFLIDQYNSDRIQAKTRTRKLKIIFGDDKNNILNYRNQTNLLKYLKNKNGCKLLDLLTKVTTIVIKNKTISSIVPAIDWNVFHNTNNNPDTRYSNLIFDNVYIMNDQEDHINMIHSGVKKLFINETFNLFNVEDVMVYIKCPENINIENITVYSIHEHSDVLTNLKRFGYIKNITKVFGYQKFTAKQFEKIETDQTQTGVDIINDIIDNIERTVCDLIKCESRKITFLIDFESDWRNIVSTISASLLNIIDTNFDNIQEKDVIIGLKKDRKLLGFQKQ